MAQPEQYAPDLARLGCFIRARRFELGLTQHALGERAGWPQAQISNLERGRYGLPSLSRLAQLAAALEVPLAALVEAAGYRLS